MTIYACLCCCHLQNIVYIFVAIIFQAHECFELGRVAYNANDQYHTILWMKEAMRRQETEENPQVDRATILDYLAWAIYQVWLAWLQIEYTSHLLIHPIFAIPNSYDHPPLPYFIETHDRTHKWIDW